MTRGGRQGGPRGSLSHRPFPAVVGGRRVRRVARDVQRPAWLVLGVPGRVCRGRLSAGRSRWEPAPRHPDFSPRGPHQASAPRHETSRRRCAASPRLRRNCYTRRKRVCTPGRASFEGRGPRPQARPPGPRWLRLPSWGASVRFVGSHGPRFFTFLSSLSSRFAMLCLTWPVVFSTIRFYEVTRHHSAHSESV